MTDGLIPGDVGASSKRLAPEIRGRLGSKLEHPSLIVELAKRGLSLSSEAQANFIDVLDTLSSDLRQVLLEADLVQGIPIDQKSAWAAFRGRRLGFLDGGVANISAMGATPVAIRVGSYVVTPGLRGEGREEFDFQVQLVDELFKGGDGSSGTFEDYFEDVGKLRDAARIACEASGLLRLAATKKPPEIIFLHGPLVNPVSPYALGTPGAQNAFPNFTQDALESLLGPSGRQREGREANFVSVYLDVLKQLASGEVTVCGVVERPSSGAPGPLVMKLLQDLLEAGTLPANAFNEIDKKVRQYQVTDSLLFECILDEGEFVRPVSMDKQGAKAPWNKIPNDWRAEIISYPWPETTYVKANVGTMPVRVEFFKSGPWGNHPEEIMRLIVHMSRLLPRYSFPVGLDIVDKHAKVPAWMSRQVSAMLAAKLMQKAMATKDPRMVKLVRRVLSSNTRDWLFRPDHKRN